MSYEIPFIDLLAQHDQIKEELDICWSENIEKSVFVGGGDVEKFEQQFANYLNIENCVSCGNGTDALEIILEAMGVGEGDQIIVPVATWLSVAEAVQRVGGVPVFADILPNEYTIDPNAITSLVNSKTVGIIPVHLYGMPARMKEIMRIAMRHHLWVIEDCAQSHGAKIHNKLTGSFGNAATFSFYPTKNLGALGDGGAIVTNDHILAQKCRTISNHGQVTKNNHILSGRNSRLDSIQAAILSIKLKYLDQWNALRAENARLYMSLLNGKVGLPISKKGFESVFHIFAMELDERDELRHYLHSSGIQTMVHYPEILSNMPFWLSSSYSERSYTIASGMKERILSLPIYPFLKRSAIEYIAQKIREFVS